MSIRRMLPFILVNVFVSATVVLAILYWWDNRNPPVESGVSVNLAPPPVPTEQEPVEPTAEVQLEPDASSEPDEPLTYVVQSGDSLGEISQQFDVPLVDLMEANGIADANFVNAGETLVIPVEGVVPPTPVPTDTPVLDTVPTPIPTLPSQGEVAIEIVAVNNPGDINEENVVLVNSGERQVNLANWQLEDEDGNAFIFASVTLFGNGVELTIHTGVGQSGLLDQFWGLNDAVWQPGETAILRDAEGTVRATTIVG